MFNLRYCSLNTFAKYFAENIVHTQKACPKNSQSCMIEIRKRDGEMEGVSFWVRKRYCESLTQWDWDLRPFITWSWPVYDGLWTLKFRFVWAAKNRKHVLLIRIKILSEAGSHGNADLGTGQRFDSSHMIQLVWLIVWRIRLSRLGVDFKLSNIFSRAPQHVANVVQNQIANLKWDVLNQLQLVTGDQIY